MSSEYEHGCQSTNGESGVWWCNTHQREATHTDEKGQRECDPKLGGITMPCKVVFAPMRISNGPKEIQTDCHPENPELQVMKFPTPGNGNPSSDYPLNFNPKPDPPKSHPAQDAFDAALLDATRRHQIAIEKTTEQQTCDLFKQAIASGDFMRHVTKDGKGQAMTYVPFREVEALKARIKALETELNALRPTSV